MFFDSDAFDWPLRSDGIRQLISLWRFPLLSDQAGLSWKGYGQRLSEGVNE